MTRVFAIGDIHGCFRALESILAEILPQVDDLVVVLGDFIDRGPESNRVVDRLIELSGQTQVVPILGNHEEMLLAILEGHQYLLGNWLSFGGLATMESYGVNHPAGIPAEHVEFLRSCRPYFETATHFFVHATYLPRKPLAKQPAEVLRWDSLRAKLPKPHRSGKTCICGHTSQKSGEVLDAGHIKCIDTHVYGEGWLTALDVDTGRLWQADRNGRLRTS
ncbi:MAG: serine/threonine protein phosphatase [Pirellulaceae bacterium]|mgnify:FL=1|jgi:serine/threonine protein phosphatase 1|nr:metallophosphoesterase [Thermoguttaceae bacterium]MDI9444998.1 metallophosphoesterase [Planctomycetota bacterium]NLZ00100.1 serine/threonine protein phosphatase [Pirellulaceae bacterium]